MRPTNSSLKTNLLNLIDQELFGSLVHTIKQTSQDARLLNGQRPFKYLCYTSDEAKYSIPPSRETRLFLDAEYAKIEKRVTQRVRIISFLLRFLNHAKQPLAVLFLIPPSARPKLDVGCESNLSAFDKDLLADFRREPEAAQLKTLVVFRSMGA